MIAGKSNPLFSPLIELFENQDFLGFEVRDPHAPIVQQAEQVADFLAQSVAPISVASGMRSTASTTAKVASYAGFNPAPRYITRTKMQNDIVNLFQKRIGGEVQKPYSARLQMEAKQSIKAAKSAGDTAKVAELEQEAERNNVLTSKQIAAQNREGKPGDVYMFNRLPDSDKQALFKKMTPEEKKRYVVETAKWYRDMTP
jgi:hypothetical protein